MSALIQAENLELFTPAGRALAHPLNFKLNAGELLLIEGPNGAGKSTLLKTMLGLHAQFKGQLKKAISSDDVAYLPQLGNVQFFLPMNLGDVVRLENDHPDLEIENLKLLKAGDLKTAWNSASGGERQKALLCRVLLSPAQVFLLDEPLNHLDYEGHKNVQSAIWHLLERGKTLAVVSHNTNWEAARVQRLKLDQRQ